MNAVPAQAIARPPLVAHVIHHLVIGGMENGVVNLINHLPAEAYRHMVVCIEDHSDFRQRIARPEVEVVAMHRSRIGARQLRIELYRLFRRTRPALVHTRNLSGLDALLPARLAGVGATVHGEHGWDVDNLDGSRWRPRLLRLAHAPLVDRYVTVSKDLERFMTQQVGLRAARVRQIYNGVDTARFRPADPREADPGWPAVGAGDGLVRIGTVGRLQPVKDQATLLRAFALLRTRDTLLTRNARLVLIGDGPLRADLEALARSLDIDAYTGFAGSSTRVPELLRGLDVFVLPSLNEGISNTLLEAMASGVPVLASAVGGNLELVDDGVVGRLFAPGDAAALAAHLADYLGDPALRQRHAAAGRARAVARFGLETMIGAYRDTYDELCAARR